MTNPCPYLEKGDKIAIIATARKISREEVAPAFGIIREAGFEPVAGPHLFQEHFQFAGNDQKRLEDLHWALQQEDIKAILIARGGYGTVRIIDQVNWSNFKTHPKWIIGYSDITVLHQQIQQLGYSSLHATMPINFLKDATSTRLLFEAISGDDIQYSFPGNKLNIEGQCKGIVTGGNLSILYSLQGSSSLDDWRDKILFIEDLDEYLYHIDRMMMQLKRAGKLQHLKALLVGGMSDMKDNSVPFGKTAEEIIYEHVHGYGYPVCFDFPAGHIASNYPIRMGMAAELIIQKDKCSFTQEN